MSILILNEAREIILSLDLILKKNKNDYLDDKEKDCVPLEKLFKTKLWTLYCINKEIIDTYSYDNMLNYINTKIKEYFFTEYKSFKALYKDIEDIYNLSINYKYSNCSRRSNYINADHKITNVVSKAFENVSFNNDPKVFVINEQNSSTVILANEFSNINFYTISKQSINNCPENLTSKTGKIADIRCTNEVFDSLILKTQYDHEFDPHRYNPYSFRQEKISIRPYFKYVKDDGLIILPIYKYRLHYDLCVMISKLLKQVNIIEYEALDGLKFLLVIGKKNPEKYGFSEIDKDVMSKLCVLNEEDKTTETNKYNITSPPKELSIFKAGEISFEEALNVFSTSDIYNEVDMFNENVENLYDRNPLLPLNSGQIGLLLASGCFNGKIEEKDGSYHIIKGKVSHCSTDLADGAKMESKKSSISILDNDGNFKVLI